MSTITERVAEGPRPFQPPNPPTQPTNYDMGMMHQCAPPRHQDFATKWNCNHEKARKLRAYRPKVIAVWMRKGGVGKTSTTYMTGASLARNGVKTMMVDCDSQQDLTETVFRKASEDADEDDVEDYLRSLLPSEGFSVRTVATLSEAVRFTLGMERNQPVDRPAWATNKNLLKPYPFRVHENLFHVSGGHDFEQMEMHFGKAMASIHNSGSDPDCNGLGSIFHAIWNAGFDCDADVILLDLSPALGSTNQSLLCHSDYFFCPCECTKLSEKNLVTIPQAMKNWYMAYQEDGPNDYSCSGIRQISRGQRRVNLPDRFADMPLPEVEPKFGGIVLGKYQVGEIGSLTGKHDRDGNLIFKSETFKSTKRASMACRLVSAAARVGLQLSRGRDDNGFSVHPKLFTNPAGEGFGVFRHKAGSHFLPQPSLLARVRQGPQLFEHAPALLGKPICSLTEDDYERKEIKDIAKNPELARETIAHYQRIFKDLARFLNYLPKAPPYNFVINPEGDDDVVFKNVDRTRLAIRWDSDLSPAPAPAAAPAPLVPAAVALHVTGTGANSGAEGS